MVLRAAPKGVIGVIQVVSGQGFAGRAGGRGVSVGGENNSCGTPDSLGRSAEQKPGCGDALLLLALKGLVQ